MSSINEKKALLNWHKKKIDYMVCSKETEKILPFLQENMEVIKNDNDLMAIWYLGMIAEKERKAGLKTVLEKESSMEELLLRSQQLKFYLRRMENDILEQLDEFYSFLAEKKVSEHELIGIIDSSIYYKEKVLACFQR